MNGTRRQTVMTYADKPGGKANPPPDVAGTTHIAGLGKGQCRVTCKHLKHVTPQILATQILLKQQPTPAPRRAAKRALKSAHFRATQVATAAVSTPHGGSPRSGMSNSDILRSHGYLTNNRNLCTLSAARVLVIECRDGGVGESRDRNL